MVAESGNGASRIRCSWSMIRNEVPQSGVVFEEDYFGKSGNSASRFHYGSKQKLYSPPVYWLAP